MPILTGQERKSGARWVVVTLGICGGILLALVLSGLALVLFPPGRTYEWTFGHVQVLAASVEIPKDSNAPLATAWQGLGFGYYEGVEGGANLLTLRIGQRIGVIGVMDK